MACRRAIGETTGSLLEDTRMDRTVIYVSKRVFPVSDAVKVIAGIVEPARLRNTGLGVTGVLVATENTFAQVIEGSEDAIETLMRSIARDPRHCDVTVLRRESLLRRRFVRWSLAYQGRSAYFEGFIRPLVAQPDAPRADVDRLVDLMDRLAAPTSRRLSHEGGSP